MNAQEARRRTNIVRDVKLRVQYDAIKGLISRAVERGENCIVVDKESISLCSHKLLEEMFHLEDAPSREEGVTWDRYLVPQTRITW